jgi:recombination protein RecA
MAKKKGEEPPKASPDKSVEPDPTKVDGDRVKSLLGGTLVKKLRKRHGDRIIQRASEASSKVGRRISTGIFPLDVALGGGVPAGLITTVWGFKSSAKTTVVLRTIANAQRVCAYCYDPACTPKSGCGKHRELVAAFIDAEGTLDLSWAERQGVKLDRLLLSTPEYAEQALDLGEQLLRTGECDLLAIDSLAFLVPLKEIEESVEKELPGVQARAVGKGIRKFTATLNERGADTDRRPTILFTNQVRHKVGVMFGSPETKPAGFAPGFAASVEVRLKPGKYKMDEEEKQGARPLYVDLGFKVDKCKVAVPMVEGVFRLMLQDTETKKLGDIYDEMAIVAEAQKIGMITGAGASWTCLDEKFRAKSEIERKMLVDPKYKSSIRSAVLTVLQS